MKRCGQIRLLLFLNLLVTAGCSSVPSAEDIPASGPSVEIVVEGNARVSTADLLLAAHREIDSFRRNGRRPADIDDAAYMMARRLREEGFASSSVKPRFEPSEDDLRRVVFEVIEGPQARLGNISFEGVHAIPIASLQPLFEFEGAGVLGTGRPFFREAQLNEAESGIDQIYRLAGYLRVEIGPLRIDWNADRTSADVMVPVVEGRRYVVRLVTVAIEDDRTTVAPALEELQTTARRAIEGKPYYVHAPTEAAAAVRGVLTEDARLLSEVTRMATIDSGFEMDEGARGDVPVDVALSVSPGPQLRVAEIVVGGNDLTDTDFILRQSGLDTGMLFRQSVFDGALKGLYGTGLFRNVKIRRELMTQAGDIRDTRVVIAVEEVDPKSVDLEVGVGTYELLRGSIGYRDRNLFGIGRDFEARTYASMKSLGVEGRFRDAYVFGRESVLEVSGGYEMRQEPSFDTTAGRAEVSVRNHISERVSIRPGYRFRTSNATDVNVNVPILRDGSTAITSGPFVALRYDGRDHPVLPTSGVYLHTDASVSTSALGADLNYVGLQLNLSTYFALSDDTVLALSAGGETRGLLDDAPTLPIQERLFLGGESNVRSFGESELGPTDSNSNPIGGLTAVHAHVEVRQRLLGDLHGAVFYDVGTVGLDGYDISGPYGHAIGVGLRYYLPIGPVRADFGYNPGQRFAADASWAISFSFGFSF